MKTTVIFLILFCTSIFINADTKSNEDSHFLVKNKIVEGTDKIDIFIDQNNVSNIKKNMFNVLCKETGSEAKNIWKSIKLKKIDFNKKLGKITIHFKEKLKGNQQLKIQLTDNKGFLKHSEIIEIEEQLFSIKNPLYGGDKEIEIYSKKNNNYKLRVNISNGFATEIENQELQNGKYTLKLDNPLAPGQEIEILAVNEQSLIDRKEFTVESPILDWGLISSNFTLGKIFSKKKSEFSDSDWYLGFEMTTRWLFPTKKRFMGLFTKFSVQLSQIPNIKEGRNNSDPKFTIESKKAATLQIEISLPFGINTWEFDKTKNRLFLAPVFKCGFHTYSEEINNKDENGDTDMEDRGNFFPFFSGGFRLGHYRIINNSKFKPELKSYFDVTFGWSDIIGAIRSKNDLQFSTDYFRNTFNLFFEGRLVLNKIPIVLGLDAYYNISKGKRMIEGSDPKSPEYYHVTVPDDLRFFIGTRININSVIKIFSNN